MKLGIPTLIEYCDIQNHVQMCKECGFDFIELNLTFPWLQKSVVDTTELNKVQNANGLWYTIHLHDQLNPVDFCDDIREACTKNILNAIRVAGELNVKYMTMHLNTGMYSSLKRGKVYLCDIYRQEYLGYVNKFIDTIGPLLEKNGVTVCIENTTGFVDAQRKALDIFLSHPNFGLTFDIGHSYKSGGCDEDYIRRHLDKLKHFHIHDVTEKMNHQALGEGIIDLPKYFDLAKQCDCNAVIEVKESSALHISRDYISKNIKNI